MAKIIVPAIPPIFSLVTSIDFLLAFGNTNQSPQLGLVISTILNLF